MPDSEDWKELVLAQKPFVRSYIGLVRDLQGVLNEALSKIETKSQNDEPAPEDRAVFELVRKIFDALNNNMVSPEDLKDGNR